MTVASWLYLAAFAGALLALAWPIGRYMAGILGDKPGPVGRFMQRILGPVERLFYRLAGVRPDDDMTWQRYAKALLWFFVGGVIFVYALQRLQGVLAGNPNQIGAVSPRVAFNTAVSFASNTNWQSYSGETQMSHLTQSLALGSQNFLSAATGIAVMAALARGLVRATATGIGNFWVDLVRTTLYVLMPLAIILALALVATGVPQTFVGKADVARIEPGVAADGTALLTQSIAVGPVASQVAIKQLGTNGGGYYGVNSAHPLENPSATSDFLEMLALLAIPGACCFAFGGLVGARRQGRAFLLTMTVLMVPFVLMTMSAEQGGNPTFPADQVSQVANADQGGGNMEGKEVRFGITQSALWATATTAASNGSVNSMHDSYTPIGSMGPMVLMQLGEVVFGGVGSGMYGLMMFAIVSVFIAGLMVGRTPEFLGKKLEAYEMKMAMIAILFPSMAVLVGTALASVSAETAGAVANPGAHGFSEVLYAMSSASNNNGSAFAGLNGSGSFYATALGICMWIGRLGVMMPVLAIAGRLASKKRIPPSSGTLPTDGPLFIGLLAGTVILVGALTFVPALALGPIVEHLALFAH